MTQLLREVSSYADYRYIKMFNLQTDAVREELPEEDPLTFLSAAGFSPNFCQQLYPMLLNAAMQEPQIWHTDMRPLVQLLGHPDLRKFVPRHQQHILEDLSELQLRRAIEDLDATEGFFLFLAVERTTIDVVEMVDGQPTVVHVELQPGSLMALRRNQVHRGTPYRTKTRRLYIACLKEGDKEDPDSTYPVDIDVL